MYTTKRKLYPLYKRGSVDCVCLIFVLFYGVLGVSSSAWGKGDSKDILKKKIVTPSKVDIYFKPGKGLVVQSKDGQNKIATRLRAMLLTTVKNKAVGDDFDSSFQIRRARLAFSGNALGKQNKYKVEFAFSSRDLGMKEGLLHRSPLLTWYLQFGLARDVNIRVGQYKIPYNRQRVISSGNLQFVDRSIANGEFNLDRDTGLDIRSNDLFGLGKLHYAVGIYLRKGRDVSSSVDFQFMYLARLEFLPFGKFKDYSSVDFARYSSPRLSLGLAYAFIDDALKMQGNRGASPKDKGTSEIHNVVFDALFKFSGFSSMLEAFYRQGSRNPVEGVTDLDKPRNGFGFFVQAGYLFSGTTFEWAVRYGHVQPFDAAGSSLPEKYSLGTALSYYFVKHPLKLQMDYFRLWSGNGISEGINQFRLQLQASM